MYPKGYFFLSKTNLANPKTLSPFLAKSRFTLSNYLEVSLVISSFYPLTNTVLQNFHTFSGAPFKYTVKLECSVTFY